MTLVDTAKDLAATFAAESDLADELRQVPDASWKHLLEDGFVRALQPKRWGGGEVPLLEFVDAMVEISAAAPSIGWVGGVIGVHPWQLALFPEQAQQDLWGDDPATMHSSSYNPTGKVRAVDGGYRLDGRWSFSSGCDRCTAVNLGAIPGMLDLGDGNEVPDYRSFLLLDGDYRIEDNWFVGGLAGTGSKDIVVDDVFVPAHRSQSHIEYALGLPLPGQELNSGPLYRLPWSVVFNVALSCSVLGAARAFIDDWIEQAKTRSVPLVGPLADEPLAQTRLAEALWTFEVTRLAQRAIVAELWEMAEASYTPTMEDRAHMRWTINRGVNQVGDAVVDLFRAASGRSIFTADPVQKRFQDVQAGLAHAYLVPDALGLAVGGNRLGTSKPQLVM